MLFNYLMTRLGLASRQRHSNYPLKKEYYTARIHLSQLLKWSRELEQTTPVNFQPLLVIPTTTDFRQCTPAQVKKKLDITYKRNSRTLAGELDILFVKSTLLQQKCVLQFQFTDKQPVYLCYEISGISKTVVQSSSKLQEVLSLFTDGSSVQTIMTALTGPEHSNIFTGRYQDWLVVIQYEFKLFIHLIRQKEEYMQLLEHAVHADALN